MCKKTCLWRTVLEATSKILKVRIHLCKGEKRERERACVHYFANVQKHIYTSLTSGLMCWYYIYEKSKVKRNFKLKRALQETSNKFTVSMHLFPIPAGIWNHDCWNSLDDWIRVRRHVDAQQSMHVNHGVVLIDAIGCPTITHKVFSTGSNLIPTRNIWKLNHRN